MNITVYSQPNCMPCKMTMRLLDQLELDYDAINVSEDDTALEHVKSLGYLQTPVIETEATHFSGYRPDLIRKLTNPSNENL